MLADFRSTTRGASNYSRRVATVLAIYASARVADGVRAAARCIDDFVQVPVAGALRYREYDVFTRTLMRLLMKRGGHPTDTSQDYDYTDWDAVERLGREFAALVASDTKL
jgi:menaquinone-dependent protoporphyrinogen IX oxidase